VTNPLFRARALSLVSTAIREYGDASGLDHMAMRGRVREIALNNVIRPFLPSAYDVGTGKIADSSGFQTPETDLVIYSRTILPPILYSEREGIFPSEASFYAIEVKSRANSAEIDDALSKAREIRKLQYSPGHYDDSGTATDHTIIPVIPVLFAFSSDLASAGKSELDRYRDHDPDADSAPLLSALCVLGQGYWWFRHPTKRWQFHSPTPEGEELVDFVSGIVNTLPNSLHQRGHPRLGLYLMIR